MCTCILYIRLYRRQYKFPYTLYQQYYLSTMFINVVIMIINKKLEGLNFSRISSFWKRLVFFVHVYFHFSFATTAVTLHWANKRVHYSKSLGVLAEVLAIWVFIDSASLPLASKKFF